MRLFLRGLQRGLFPGRGLEETPAPPCRLSPSLRRQPPPTSAWAPLPGLGPPVKAAQPLPPGRSHPTADGVEDASGPGPVCPAPRRAFWPCEAKTPTVRAARPSPSPGTSLRPGDRAGRPILTGLRPLPQSLQSLPWAVLSALKTPPSRAEGWERGTPPSRAGPHPEGLALQGRVLPGSKVGHKCPMSLPHAPLLSLPQARPQGTPSLRPCRSPLSRAPAALCYP